MGSHLGQPSRAAISGQASRGKPSRAATSGQAISGQASRAAASGRPYRASISGSHLEQPSRAVISGQAFRGKHGGAAISASHIGQPSRTTMSGSHPGGPARAAILGKSANPNTTLEAAALAAAMAPQRKEPASGKWKEEMGAGGVKEINEKEIRRKSRKMGAEKGFPCTCNFIERGPKSRPPSGTHLGHENDSPSQKNTRQRLVFSRGSRNDIRAL